MGLEKTKGRGRNDVLLGDGRAKTPAGSGGKACARHPKPELHSTISRPSISRGNRIGKVFY
jgi:hypothetical protein